MSASAWVGYIEATPPLEVANAVGLETQIGKGTSAGSFACPSCGARTRHHKSKDKRLAVGVSRSGGARCFECGVGFNAFGIVCHAIGGASWADLGDHRRAEVRDWCARFAGVVGGDWKRPAVRAADRVAPRQAYPAAADVAALVASCRRADADEDVSAWLKSRALDASDVADLQLGSAIDVASNLPAWASRWPGSGHRFVVPLYDANGELRSVLARLVRSPREGERKSLAPAGFARAGLCLADPLARHILRSGAVPDWWDSRHPPTVVLCEGEINAITHATRVASRSDSYAPATFGLFSGGWTDAHTGRLPSGTTVVVSMDPDQGGEALELPIFRSLATRRDLVVIHG